MHSNPQARCGLDKLEKFARVNKQKKRRPSVQPATASIDITLKLFANPRPPDLTRPAPTDVGSFEGAVRDEQTMYGLNRIVVVFRIFIEQNKSPHKNGRPYRAFYDR